MRLEWNEDLAAWLGDAAAPGSGSDPAVGPPGPAGVAVLRRGYASVSLCYMTGRVTSIWFGENPGSDERQLLGLVVTRGSMQRLNRPAGPEPLDIKIIPAAERLDVVDMALLADAIRHNQHPPPASVAPSVAMARFLQRAEYAVVLARLHDRAPEQIAQHEVREALANSDTEATQLAGALRNWSPDSTDPQRDEPERQLRGLLKDIKALTANPPELGRATLGALRDATGALRDATESELELPVWRGGHTLGLAAAQWPSQADELGTEPVKAGPPTLKLIHTSSTPQQVGPVLEVTPDDEGRFDLGELAPSQLGFAAQGGWLAARDHWVTIQYPIDPQHQRRTNLWVVCQGTEGGTLGAGQFGVDEGTAIADIAVSGTVERLVFVDRPLRPAETDQPGGRIEAALRLSRAAYWAQRRNDTRTGKRWFSAATLRWIELGRMYRAGWAWTLSDQNRVRQALDELDLTIDVAAALEAMAASGDIPSAEGVGEVPAWVRVVHLDDLVAGTADE